MSLVEQQPWAIETSVFGTYLHVSVLDEKNARETITTLFQNNDIELQRIEKITPSLEDVFIYLLDQESKKAS